jgi:RHS repeat-associated protein
MVRGSNYPFLTQKERDVETGLDYFLARYYSSTMARFTSPDEFTGSPKELGILGTGHSTKQALKLAEITNPQSLNKYQYTYNNPLRYIDADGQSPQDSYELNLQRDEKALLAGKMSPEQFLARQYTRGAGAAAGLVVLAAIRGGGPIM